MEIKLTKKERIKISNTKDLYEIMCKILAREGRYGRNREHFWVVGLDEDYMLLFIELIALGTDNKFIVNPSEVFQMAIHKQSTYVILVHNHPGQDPAPSEADIDLTDQLMHAAEIINLKVIEHLIIGNPDHDGDAFYSFTYSGLLAELEKSQKYAVHYIEEAKIKEEGVELGKAKGKKEGKKKREIEIAKELIKNKVSIDIIVKSTGLSKAKVTKLSKTKKKDK